MQDFCRMKAKRKQNVPQSSDHSTILKGWSCAPLGAGLVDFNYLSFQGDRINRPYSQSDRSRKSATGAPSCGTFLPRPSPRAGETQGLDSEASFEISRPFICGYIHRPRFYLISVNTCKHLSMPSRWRNQLLSSALLDFAGLCIAACTEL